MTDYEQKLYDMIADWWDEVFAVNPPPVDRDGEYMDKNSTIIDLVKYISEINALREKKKAQYLLDVAEKYRDMIGK